MFRITGQSSSRKDGGKCHVWKGIEYEYTVLVVHKLKLFVFEEEEKGEKETTILQKFFLLSGFPASPTYHSFFPHLSTCMKGTCLELINEKEKYFNYVSHSTNIFYIVNFTLSFFYIFLFIWKIECFFFFFTITTSFNKNYFCEIYNEFKMSNHKNARNISFEQKFVFHLNWKKKIRSPDNKRRKIRFKIC